jgi:transcriptional regulator with XRE-family HTH domain
VSDLTSKIRDQIRERFKRDGRSQNQLAKDSGVAQSNIQRIVGPEPHIGMTIDLADRLCTSLGLNLGEVIIGQEPSIPAAVGALIPRLVEVARNEREMRVLLATLQGIESAREVVAKPAAKKRDSG